MGRLITASGKSVLISNAGNPILNGIFLVQNDLINGRKWYKRGNNLAIAWSTVDSLWVIYIIGSPAILHYSISAAQNPWDTSWDDVGIVTQAINLSDKKISIKKQNFGGGKMTSINLLRYLSNQIDPIIENLTANNSTLKLFSTEQPNGICCQGVNSTNPVNPVYIRNTSCWAKDIDTSPISIWNNGGGYPEPEHAGGTGGTGILITRKHIILAAHFRMKIGSKLIFVDMNNNTYVRTLVNIQTVNVFDPWLQQFVATDILIGVLDSDLPNSVSNIKILDPNIATKLSTNLANNKRLPVFVMDQNRKAYVAELISNLSISNNPTNPSKRREFYPNPGIYGLVGGDSANTCSIVYNNKLVHIFHFYFANSGVSAYQYINNINQVINSLGNPNGYQVEIESFII